MRPSLQFIKELLRITHEARQSGVPPEVLIKYLRDMADDIADNETK